MSFVPKDPECQTDDASDLREIINDLRGQLRELEESYSAVDYSASIVFDRVTEGRVSKPNTHPDVVTEFLDARLEAAHRAGFSAGLEAGAGVCAEVAAELNDNCDGGALCEDRIRALLAEATERSPKGDERGRG
jgi:hypothetical protein